MNEATFLPARPLARTVTDALGEPTQTCLVAGAPHVARALTRAGHSAELWPDDRSTPPAGLERYDALVLVGQLTRTADPAAFLRPLVAAARPGAWVFLAEPAAWGSGGRWLSRWVGRILRRPVTSDVVELGAVCLGAGLTDLRQVWPQGLRSLVLTQGRVHPLARTLIQ